MTRHHAALVCLALLAASCGGGGGGGNDQRRFVASEPERVGPLAVQSYDLSFDVDGFGTYDATVFFPEPDGSGAPWPAIVAMNGYLATAPMMSWLTQHLASHGYVVLGVTPPTPWSLDVTQWARGFTDGLDALARESERDGSPIAGMVDPVRLGAIGISMGASGALEAAGRDARVRAMVGLAPGWSDIGSFVFEETLQATAAIEAPTQIQIGSEDCLVGLSGPRGYYDAMPARKQYLEIQGANHIGFINEALANVATPLVTDAVPVDCLPAISYGEQHRVSAKYATMWFDAHLYETKAWDDALYGAGLDADLASRTLAGATYAAPQR